MRSRRHWAAAALLAALTAAAHAEHFQYAVNLSGTYSLGGTDGCTPPDFNQPACPRPGTLSAMLSFDTPSSADGTYMIGSDVTDFVVTLGALPGDLLFGGIDLIGGVPDGAVFAADGTESFVFNAGQHSASYSYDYGYHQPNGSFSGVLSAVPEPSRWMMVLAGLAASAAIGRRATTKPRRA